MGASKVFLSCLTTLILFNLVFYLVTTTGKLAPIDFIISNFMTFGLIAVVASIIPFTGGETAMKWFISTLMIVCIIFRLDNLTILGYSFSIGLGLGSNMINLFVSDISGLGLLPFLFFTFISLIATISGIMLTAGGGD